MLAKLFHFNIKKSFVNMSLLLEQIIGKNLKKYEIVNRCSIFNNTKVAPTSWRGGNLPDGNQVLPIPISGN